MPLPCKILLLSVCCLLVYCRTPEIPDTAQNTLLEADSLYACGGMYSDTIALRDAVSHFEKANRKNQYNDDLARLYYYLGRNHTLNNNDIEAVKCYIAADRLQSSDYELRGRINSNFGHLCRQIDSLKWSFDYFDKAKTDFVKAGDSLRVAHTILYQCFLAAELGDFILADSIWNIGSGYNTDSLYLIQLYLDKANIEYCKRNYKSALYYLNKTEPDSSDYRIYLLMQTYYSLNQKSAADYYARYLVENSSDPNCLTDAYYILEENAMENGDIQNIDAFFHKRADADSIIMDNKINQLIAFNLLKSDENNNEKWFYKYRLVIISFFILVVAVLGLIVNYYRKKNTRFIQINRTIKDAYYFDVYQNLQHSIASLNEKDCLSELCWDDDEQFLKKINEKFFSFADKVMNINPKISLRDVRLYMLVLFDFRQKEIADLLNLSLNSIKNTKQVAARKLNSSSKQLKQNLIDIICGSAMN